jgi:hypothetical protein
VFKHAYFSLIPVEFKCWRKTNIELYLCLGVYPTYSSRNRKSTHTHTHTHTNHIRLSLKIYTLLISFSCSVKYDPNYKHVRNRDSSVVQGWATGWKIGNSSPGRVWKFFSSPPPIEWIPGALSLGVKLPKRKADHSSAEVKNA